MNGDRMNLTAGPIMIEYIKPLEQLRVLACPSAVAHQIYWPGGFLTHLGLMVRA